MKTPASVSCGLALVALVALSSASASAQVLFDNGSAALGSNGYGVFADTGSAVDTLEGNVFVAPTSGTADSISFSGIYYGPNENGTNVSLPASDSFVISLYAVNNAGAPDTTVAPILSDLSSVTRTYDGAGHSQPIYNFTGGLDTPLTLTAGTSYFLGISDTTTSFEDFAVAQSSDATAASINYGIDPTTGNLVNYDAIPLAFTLSVPEPSGMSLFVIGAMAILALGKMLRRAALK